MIEPIGNSIDETAAVEDLRFLQSVLPRLQSIMDRGDWNTHVDFTECDIEDALAWVKSTIEDLDGALEAYYRRAS